LWRVWMQRDKRAFFASTVRCDTSYINIPLILIINNHSIVYLIFSSRFIDS
jgi:hypothetical protein